MLKRARLGARPRAFLAAATVLALSVVGAVPAYAAPPAPTNVHIVSGDNYVNAAEVAAGVKVTGNYDTTAVPPIDRVLVRVVNSPTCDAGAVQTTLAQTIIVAGGAWEATFDVGPFSEGAILCARARSIDTTNQQSFAVSFSDNLPVKDTIAPANPTVSIDSDPITLANVGTVAVSGTSEGNGSVLVDLTSGTTVSGGGAVPPGGTYNLSFNATSLSDGTVTATVRGFDQAGNEAAATGTDTAFKDATKPAIPGLTLSPTLITALNVGSFKATVTGEIGTTLALTANDTDGLTPAVIASVPLSASPLDVPLGIAGLTDGTITVTATLTDGVGNVSDVASATATKDVVGPAAPFIVAPGPNQLVKAFFQVAGTSEPGTEVEVFDITDPTKPPQSLGKNVASVAGHWSVNAVYTVSGTKLLVARAKDFVGNLSALSATRTIDVDAVRPELAILSPAGYDLKLPGSELVIEGTAIDDRSGVLAIDLHIFNALGQDIAQVEIKNLTCVVGCPVKRKVTWTYKPVLSIGVYTFKAWAIDLAGNRTPQPQQVTVVKAN